MHTEMSCQALWNKIYLLSKHVDSFHRFERKTGRPLFQKPLKGNDALYNLAFPFSTLFIDQVSTVTNT